MKRYLTGFALIMMFPLLESCNNFGKEKDYDGVQLYHTPAITDSQADSLGNFLVSQKFADGSAKTVQIAKSGNTYQFRFVIKADADKDPALSKTLKAFASVLSSNVFNGSPVEVDMCDEYLKTLKVYPYEDFGRVKIYDGVQLYYTKSITSAGVDSLGNYLVSSKFADGNAKTVQITKPANVFQFRFVVKKGLDKDPQFLQNCGVFASQLSQKVYNGAPVEIQVCDDNLGTLTVVPMNKM
jgi:hypothetical protein